jgi:hypothetical protein
MPTVILQPTSTEGKDVYVRKGYNGVEHADTNFSNVASLSIRDVPGQGSRDIENILIEFDLSEISKNAIVSDAKLDLCLLGGAYNESKDFFTRPLLSAWTEDTVTWNTQPQSHDSIADSTTGVTFNNYGYKTFNAKNTVQENIKNNNYGFVISANVPGSFLNQKTFYSSENSQFTPKLTITYNEPPTKPTILSPNGGESWNSAHEVSWQASSDVETTQTSLKYQIQLSVDNGVNYRDIVPLTAANAMSYNYDFSAEPETSLAKIRIRAYDGSAYGEWDESDGVFTIQHNLPPTPPTDLSPNGISVDRTLVQRFSWKHNDPNVNDTQSKSEIQWRLQGNTTWNTIINNSFREYYDVSANVFPAGQIEWRVKTFDQTGIESPYSLNKIFTSAEPTNSPVIITPTASISVARPTIQWTVPEQISYQIIIDNNLGDTLWDTGEINSTIKARTISVDLQNGGQYVIKLRTKNNDGLWSEYAILNAVVSYTPPAKPSITATGATGHIVIEIENPSPSGTQPTVAGNDVYKRINGEWVRIAEGVNFVPYRDYAVASGVEYNYKVRAIGDNGTFSESNVDFTSTTFRGVWLHTINNAEVTVHNFKFDGGGRESSWEVESSLMRFKGRARPVIETGEMKDDLIDFNLTLKDDADKEALERIVKSQEIVCYRDGRGRVRFGVFTKFPLSDEIWGGYTTSLQLLYIDYSEGI